MLNDWSFARVRKMNTSMETDSGQSSMASSAASTPSPTTRSQSNPLETDSSILPENDNPFECKERQCTAEEPTGTTSSQVEMAPRPPLETQKLLNQEHQATAPRRRLYEVAGQSANKCWKILKNPFSLLLIGIMAGGVLAYFLCSSSVAGQPLPLLDPCPNEDWMYYRKSCYYYNENRTDWNASQNVCAEYGATLAVIDKEGELDSIIKSCRTDCWIGLYKTEDGFQWVDGTSYNSSLFKVLGQGECAYVKSNSISVTDCKLPRPSLCKMEPYRV